MIIWAGPQAVAICGGDVEEWRRTVKVHAVEVHKVVKSGGRRVVGFQSLGQRCGQDARLWIPLPCTGVTGAKEFHVGGGVDWSTSPFLSEVRLVPDLQVPDLIPVA